MKDEEQLEIQGSQTAWFKKMTKIADLLKLNEDNESTLP